MVIIGKDSELRLLKNLEVLPFLRKCDIEGYNFSHIKTEAKYKYNLLKPKVLKVKIEIAGEFNDED
jgi:hypothetical protein